MQVVLLCLVLSHLTDARGPPVYFAASTSRPARVAVDVSPTMPPPSPLAILPTSPPTNHNPHKPHFHTFQPKPTQTTLPRGTVIPVDPPIGVAPNSGLDCTIKWEGSFSDCSVSCGVGVRTMKSVIDRPALPGGICPALPVQYQKCELPACPSALSARSCAELTWFVPPQWYGSDKVCGGSKVQPMGNGYNCSDRVSYDVAAYMCLTLGARLCTAQELLKDEARFSGCSLDTEMVWANSSVSPCSSDQGILSVGASSIPEKIPSSVCVSKSSLNPVRCCADVWSTPCRSNECAVKEVVTNKCFQDGVTNRCMCDTVLGWSVSPLPGGGQTCVLNDPCKGNPCRIDAGNVCVPDLPTLTFVCVCNNGWRTGSEAQFCLSPTNMCLKGDPCLEGNGNLCIDNKNGTYYCQCGSFGYSQGDMAQSCVAPLNPCVGEVCFTFMPGNQCVDHKDGSYHCVCRAQNWAVGPKNAFGYAQSCIPPPRVCVDRVLCQSSYRGNECVENYDGTYHCVCNALNWGGTNTTSCKPYRQCAQSFTCSADLAPLNKCIDNRNGSYTCVCAQPGWSAGELDDDYNAQICNPPPCAGCLTQQRGNHCVQVGNQAGVQCQCNAKGYILGQSKISPSFCIPPVKQCLSSRVCSTGYKGNNCYDNQDGTFRCECRAVGWNISSDMQSCIAPPRKCDDLSTCTQSVRGNVCKNSADGSYYCVCQGLGYSQGIDDRSCNPPKPVCVSPADCSTGVPGNQCQDNQDGTYRCLCGGSTPGRVDSKGNILSCVTLKHCTASGPPCWSQIPGNTCIDYPDGSYSCVCNGLGWTIGQGNSLGIQSCVPPPRVCENTQACRTENSGNTCVERDGGYYCVCNAQGWSTGPGSASSEIALYTQNRPQSCVQRAQQSPSSVFVAPRLLNIERNCTDEQSRACGVVNGNGCHGKIDGTYNCVCLTYYYLFNTPITTNTATAVTASRFRQKFSPQCLLHPCLRFNPPVCGGNNTCISLPDGQYQCRCSEAGWRESYDPLGPVLDPPLLPTASCIDDPEGILSSSSSPLVCNDLLSLIDCSSDVSLISSLTNPGFSLAQLCPRSCHACPPRSYVPQNISTRVRGCLPPEKWCAVEGRDPCVTAAGNRCVDQGATYYCVCQLPTWIAGPSSLSLATSNLTFQDTPPSPLSCVYNRCQNPLVCRTDVSGNSCQQSYADYFCECDTDNFYPATLIGRDLAPYFTCLSGVCDADAITACGGETEGNVCVSYTDKPSSCICAAPGWSEGPKLSPYGVRSCVQNPCSHDLCVTSVKGNICINTSLTSYGCVCNNPAWKSGSGKPPQSCVADPCGMNSCRTDVQGNSCTDLSQGLYSCTCNASCWQTAADKCIPPVNPCSPSDASQDYCRILESPFNACKQRFGGGYECTCNAPSQEVLYGGLACGPPDKCASLNDTRWWGDPNICAISSGGGVSSAPSCFGAGNMSEAMTVCQTAGARLCTQTEVTNGETQGSGCGGDFARIWSASPCQGGFISLGGSDQATDVTPQCSLPSRRLLIRCCLDAMSSPPPSLCGQ